MMTEGLINNTNGIMNKEKRDLFDGLIRDVAKNVLGWKDCEVLISDISSGNINYIYRVQHDGADNSVIFKFADNETRVKPDGYLAPERNAHEASCLKWYAKCQPRFVPKVLHVDKENHFFVMEDLSDTITLREAFMKNLVHPTLGATIATIIIETSFPLLDVVRKKKTENLPCWNTTSNDLLALTEQLVFEDPYYNRRGKNIYTQGNEEFIKKALDNDELLGWVEKLKKKFKTCKQALIHGDLHTGSILVRATKDGISNKTGLQCSPDLYVMDTEFACYGPVSYDLGNVAAHIFFAQAFNFYHAETDANKKLLFEQFEKIHATLLLFFKVYAEKKLNGMLWQLKGARKAFVKQYVQDILIESIRYAGCEIIRRVVGSAKVPELMQLTNNEDQISMERALIEGAVGFIIDPIKTSSCDIT